jgi:hypothetical protein
VRPSSGGAGSPSRRGPRPGCSARWPARWSASNWTASPDGPWPAAPRRRLGRTAGSACRPISMLTSSRVSPGLACTRARPTPARSPRRARPELPVLLVDGVVGGVWHQRRSGRRTSVLRQYDHHADASAPAPYRFPFTLGSRYVTTTKWPTVITCPVLRACDQRRPGQICQAAREALASDRCVRHDRRLPRAPGAY